jgi:hypothetical protein
MTDPRPSKAAPKPAAPAQQISGPFSDPARLPPRIAALRARMIEAAESGDIEKLRIPIEWNEVPPIFERGTKKGPGFDPLDVLKTRSFDGKGAEMLAILKSVMEAPFVIVKRGPFESYVWPAFALVPPKDPDAATRLQMLRGQRFADLAANPPLLHIVRIGADGTWHTFMPEP